MLARFCQIPIALLFLTSTAVVSHADPTVYSQPYTTAEDTTWDSYTAPGATPATVYDGFALAAAANVTAVQWQGTYINHDDLTSNPAASNVASFIVSFYADNNGQPGAQLATATLPVAACAETSLGTVGFNAFNDPTTHQISYYTYRASLPAPFAAAAGQTYWLSVVGNDGAATPIWSWYASTADGDTTCLQDFSGNRITRPHDRAFALEGTAATATTPTATAAVTAKKANANTGMPGVFTLTLSAPAASKVKVKYVLGGTATNGTDYKALSGKAKFKPGQTSVDVQVVPQGDLGGASNKTVTLALQSGNGYTVGTTKAFKVKIVHTNVIILP